MNISTQTAFYCQDAASAGKQQSNHSEAGKTGFLSPRQSGRMLIIQSDLQHYDRTSCYFNGIRTAPARFIMPICAWTRYHNPNTCHPAFRVHAHNLLPSCQRKLLLRFDSGAKFHGNDIVKTFWKGLQRCVFSVTNLFGVTNLIPLQARRHAPFDIQIICDCIQLLSAALEE